MTADIKPGDVLLYWDGWDQNLPGREVTVDRLTKTQIVDTRGIRWSRETLKRVASHSFDPRGRLYRPDGPAILNGMAKEKARRERAALRDGVYVALDRWVADNTADALRAAIVALAPHLGLTVTAER